MRCIWHLLHDSRVEVQARATCTYGWTRGRHDCRVGCRQVKVLSEADVEGEGAVSALSRVCCIRHAIGTNEHLLGVELSATPRLLRHLSDSPRSPFLLPFGLDRTSRTSLRTCQPLSFHNLTVRIPRLLDMASDTSNSEFWLYGYG